MGNKNTDRYISYILRHKPEDAGVTLDEHGWANVEELIAAVNKTHPLDMELLEEFVAGSDKKRFSFNDDKTRIRANHGHTVDVDLGLDEVRPPDTLYHGTAEQFETAIDTQGLISKNRVYVHLSVDEQTALKVGARHGQPVLYRVFSGKMYGDGYAFHRSESGIWLTKRVPHGYLEKVSV